MQWLELFKHISDILMDGTGQTVIVTDHKQIMTYEGMGWAGHTVAETDNKQTMTDIAMGGTGYIVTGTDHKQIRSDIVMGTGHKVTGTDQ